MASREIRWTIKATQDKLAIYEYWTTRNKSVLYAQKLEKLFNEALKIIAIYPSAGINTELTDVRIQIIKDFKIVYRIKENVLEVLTVWDTRQNPKNLKF
ncbi:MAG: type II toxin-antitoxin system RelE/ParE family toxin [Aequorivita sp.]|nr:type II toxin-antitoxin system RelE/ParE family toxin [Aequorivita sp.]